MTSKTDFPWDFDAKLDRILVIEEQCLHALDRIIAGQAAAAKQATKMANTLDDVITAVAAEKTADDSIVTLVEGFAAQLTVAGPVGQPVTPAQQALIDEAVANATANAAEISAAINANVLPTPPSP